MSTPNNYLLLYKTHPELPSKLLAIFITKEAAEGIRDLHDQHKDEDDPSAYEVREVSAPLDELVKLFSKH